MNDSVTSQASASNPATIRLTQYSHGAGCGCKIAPNVLERILHTEQPSFQDPRLLVGNETRDDAAVYQINEQQCLISTTDFFMPIVDDPFDFGRIAAANAISDIYAMGGTPVMAIAILGWPVNTLPPEIARNVVEGGRHTCQQARIVLAGGHSIDTPEPIFGLAVTGLVSSAHIKKNSTATAGCKLYLSKPLGIGILTTAGKKSLLPAEHQQLAINTMCQLNSAGAHFAQLTAIKAMTDVTGFGLAGHLTEMCQSANLRATIHYAALPKLPEVEHYINLGCVPGGCQRNFASYGQHLADMPELWRHLLCDPQTSGGLLLAVTADGEAELLAEASRLNVSLSAIGELHPAAAEQPMIEII